MKKSLVGPIITAIVVVLIAAIFVYFYLQLNRLDQKITAIQTVAVDDSNKVTAVINFLNANLNAQTNQQ